MESVQEQGVDLAKVLGPGLSDKEDTGLLQVFKRLFIVWRLANR